MLKLAQIEEEGEHFNQFCTPTVLYYKSLFEKGGNAFLMVFLRDLSKWLFKSLFRIFWVTNIAKLVIFTLEENQDFRSKNIFKKSGLGLFENNSIEFLATKT